MDMLIGLTIDHLHFINIGAVNTSAAIHNRCGDDAEQVFQIRVTSFINEMGFAVTSDYLE